MMTTRAEEIKMHAPQHERRIRYIEMTPAEWAKVPDNPRQRDTELHAKSAIKYLQVPQPPHAQVEMAALPDGSRWKLNGHTRSLLWGDGRIPVPPVLHVTVYEMWTYNDVIESYEWFDNAAAAERGTDILQGAIKANGLTLETKMLRSGKFGSALRRVFLAITRDFGSDWHNYALVYEAVRYFARELKAFDELAPTGKLFPPGVQMALLLTMKRNPQEAGEFWKLYSTQSGVKDGTSMDAVQAYIEAVLRAKGANRNFDITGDLFAKGISAFLSHQAGELYKVGGTGVRVTQGPALKKYIGRLRS